VAVRGFGGHLAVDRDLAVDRLEAILMPSVHGRLVGEVAFDAVNEAADYFGFLDVAAPFDGLFDRGLFLSK